MSEIKTKETNTDVYEFIRTIADSEQKIKDSLELLHLMQESSGFEAKMWGASIIGFGKYHYKSERSRQEGDWPLVGFSPRKAAISLYVFTGGENHEIMLKQLGKFKMGKSCIYIKKLSDINENILKNLITDSIHFLQGKYGIVN